MNNYFVDTLKSLNLKDIYKSRNGESGKGMRGMMRMREIRVGMQGIRVGMQGIRVKMQGIEVGIWRMQGMWEMGWECGESGWECGE